MPPANSTNIGSNHKYHNYANFTRWDEDSILKNTLIGLYMKCSGCRSLNSVNIIIRSLYTSYQNCERLIFTSQADNDFQSTHDFVHSAA